MKLLKLQHPVTFDALRGDMYRLVMAPHTLPWRAQRPNRLLPLTELRESLRDELLWRTGTS